MTYSTVDETLEGDTHLLSSDSDPYVTDPEEERSETVRLASRRREIERSRGEAENDNSKLN
jgi:hypothetical protein